MAFAYQFRFKPWDVDRLTLPEFAAFCSAIEHLGEGASDGDSRTARGA